jgi:nitroreductase
MPLNGETIMIKIETLNIIKQRRSCNNFEKTQIKDEEVQSIIKAGLYAPNAGDQERNFTVVQNQELLERLNLAAKEVAKQNDMEELRNILNTFWPVKVRYSF